MNPNGPHTEVEALATALAQASDAACNQVLRAEAAERSRDEFMACVVHRLKSPMVPIRGYAELLRIHWNDFTDEQVHEFLQVIVDNIDKLQEVIDTNLDYMKGELDQWAVNTLSIPDLCPHLQRFVEEQHFAGEGRLEFECEGPTSAVRADPELLQQLLHHLVENAFAYGDASGKVIVRVKEFQTLVAVEVDNATVSGKKPLDSSIFDPMVRGEASAKGHGFGLNIVKRYARSMAGDVTMRQVDGRTVFSLWLRREVFTSDDGQVLRIPLVPITIGPTEKEALDELVPGSTAEDAGALWSKPPRERMDWLMEQLNNQP